MADTLRIDVDLEPPWTEAEVERILRNHGVHIRKSVRLRENIEITISKVEPEVRVIPVPIEPRISRR